MTVSFGKTACHSECEPIGEPLRMQRARVIPRHRSHIVVCHIRVDAVPATGSVDQLIPPMRLEQFQGLASELSGKLWYVSLERRNAIEPQRPPFLGQKSSRDVEAGRNAKLTQHGGSLYRIALLAIVKGQQAEGPSFGISQAGQKLVVRDEVEETADEIDVETRVGLGQRVVVHDDSATELTDGSQHSVL